MKDEEKKNCEYFERAYNLIDFDVVETLAAKDFPQNHQRAVAKVPDRETEAISNDLAEGEYDLAYKKLCLKQNENDRRALLRKEAEEAMKQNGIERPRREKYKKNDPRKKLADDKYRREREEYVRRRAEYEEQLDEKVCVPDRGFINHDNNLEMFELSAKFDMLRRNMKTFILPGIAICIGDTIASISDCFVCRRNGKCNYSHRDGLCKDCFHAKHDNKLCVDCKKNKRRKKGYCAEVASGNKVMKL